MRLTAGGHAEPLVVDASELEFCDGAGASLLLARWSIVDGADRKILRVRKSSFSEPIADGGYEATVASMSRAVAALSREIAAGIRDLSAN